MNKLIAATPLFLLAACGSLATTEVSYYAFSKDADEQVCSGAPDRAGIMATQSVRIFDDAGVLCEYDASNQLVGTYTEVPMGQATYAYTVVDDPMAAKPVRTFGPIETAE